MPFFTCFFTEVTRTSCRYSLSDSPSASDHFRISVKRERGIRATDPTTGAVDTTHAVHPGWLSNLLHDTLKEGDPVEVAYPFGDFFLDDSDSPVVLLSAGVGITPLTSMLHAALERPKPRPVSWLQVVHSAKMQPLNAEVRRLLKTQPALVKRAVFFSESTEDAVLGEDYDFRGRMDLAKVNDETLRLADATTQYYICGPERFMADMGKALKAQGVNPSRIHAEVFGAGDVPI